MLSIVSMVALTIVWFILCFSLLPTWSLEADRFLEQAPGLSAPAFHCYTLYRHKLRVWCLNIKQTPNYFKFDSQPYKICLLISQGISFSNSPTHSAPIYFFLWWKRRFVSLIYKLVHGRLQISGLIIIIFIHPQPKHFLHSLPLYQVNLRLRLRKMQNLCQFM